MFRYIIVLLLINKYYSSLGYSVGSNTSLYVTNTVASLEKVCKDPFLSNQVKFALEGCSSKREEIGKIRRIQCLIFYDINSRLCDAVAKSKVALKEEYTTKLNENQDVNNLCREAQSWTFSNITADINYKENAEDVFKVPGLCGQVCGMNDLSVNSNYYCKYYKWGLEVLSHMTPTTTTQGGFAVPVEGPMPGREPEVKPNENIANENTSTDFKVKNDTITLDVNLKDMIKKTTPGKVEQPSSDAIASPIVSGPTTKQIIKTDIPNTIQEIKGDVNKPESAVIAPESVNSDQISINKPEEADKQLPYIPENDKDHKDPVIEQPNTKEHSGPALGSDELKDTFEDSIDGMADDEDENIEQAQPVPQVKPGSKLPNEDNTPMESSNGAYYATNREIYAEDDDHFFTFFLTTVVLVVLLYILYHNKNKVSKLFFGLMVEGRQSDRRRNSRGHAYRRLDTLEQAMSGKSAAAPSKIIY